MKNCPRCGRENPDDVRCCQSCLKALDQIVVVPQEPQQKQGQYPYSDEKTEVLTSVGMPETAKKKRVSIVAVCLVAALLIGVALVFQGRDNEQTQVLPPKTEEATVQPVETEPLVAESTAPPTEPAIPEKPEEAEKAMYHLALDGTLSVYGGRGKLYDNYTLTIKGKMLIDLTQQTTTSCNRPLYGTTTVR